MAIVTALPKSRRACYSLSQVQFPLRELSRCNCLKAIVTEYSMPRKAKLTIKTVRVRKVKVTEKKHPEPKSPPKPEPEPQEKPKAPVAEPMAAPLPEHTQKRPIGEWPLQPGHRYA